MRHIIPEIEVAYEVTGVEAGYLDRERVGRRNRYTIRAGLPISLPARRDIDLNALLNVLLPDSSSDERREAMPAAD